MGNKDKLKEWKLLKTKDEYDFFYRITKMWAGQKIEEFGTEFLHDLEILTDIVRNGKKKTQKFILTPWKGMSAKLLPQIPILPCSKCISN